MADRVIHPICKEASDDATYTYDPDLRLEPAGKVESIVVKRTVCYIVCGLLFRGSLDSLEVLLVQEAKEECQGKWYMPAGRMERGETIEEGVRREVLEETGLNCVPEDLICVEAQGGGWYRFTFFCQSKDGELKTLAEADKESMQAKWFPVRDVLDKKVDYRARDMLRLVTEGEKYCKLRSISPRISRRVNQSAVSGMFIQLLVVQKKASKLEVLLSRDSEEEGERECRLPLVQYTLNHFPMAVVSKFYRELLKDGAGVVDIPCSCVAIDSLPIPPGEHDGLCLTLLCVVKPKMNPVPTRMKYFWAPVENEKNRSVIEKLMESGPAFFLL